MNGPPFRVTVFRFAGPMFREPRWMVLVVPSVMEYVVAIASTHHPALNCICVMGCWALMMRPGSVFGKLLAAMDISKDPYDKRETQTVLTVVERSALGTTEVGRLDENGFALVHAEDWMRLRDWRRLANTGAQTPLYT